jgi:twitching motility protein PilT
MAMNYTKKLFEYFRENENRRHILITPHAPPVERLSQSIDVAMDEVWDEIDINDTIIGLKTYGAIDSLSSKKPEDTSSLSDTFSMSVKGTGRFRISYFTQRGSKAFSMKRIPIHIANSSDLDIDEQLAEKLLQILCNQSGGVIALFGPSALSNSKLAYALLKDINSKERKVILVTERELSHLMRHDNSIVVQREIGSDSESIEDCIREGMDINPDIIFAGDILLTDNISSLVRASETQTTVMLSLVATEKELFTHILKTICKDQYQIIERRMQEVVKVMPQPDGKISATIVT